MVSQFPEEKFPCRFRFIPLGPAINGAQHEPYRIIGRSARSSV